jgi:hypothetical protein
VGGNSEDADCVSGAACRAVVLTDKEHCMKKRHFYYICYLVLFMMFLQGCKYEQPKYGTEFNFEREKIGLPILQENWEYVKIHGVKNGYVNSWINPIMAEENPYYFDKTISFSKDTIIRETDKYIGRQKIETIDGTFKEVLYVTYNFVKNENNDVGWNYVLRTGERYTATNTGKEHYSLQNINITKESADSILTSWGLR